MKIAPKGSKSRVLLINLSKGRGFQVSKISRYIKLAQNTLEAKISAF
jgi:hypothetical protein